MRRRRDRSVVVQAALAALALLLPGCGSRDHRTERIEQLERARAQIPDGAVLFIGSSTIERFPLPAAFAGRACANLGVADEDSAQMLERLPRTLPKTTPSGIVLYAGSADLRFDPKLSAEQIRERVARVVDHLSTRYSAVPISMIEVLPARRQTEEQKKALGALNRELADLARARKLDFIPTNKPPLANKSGDLAEPLSTDANHLTLDGYLVFSRWILEDGGDAVALLR